MVAVDATRIQRSQACKWLLQWVSISPSRYFRYMALMPLAKWSSAVEQVIVDDFAQLGKAGLSHPMMADIENALGISR